MNIIWQPKHLTAGAVLAFSLAFSPLVVAADKAAAPVASTPSAGGTTKERQAAGSQQGQVTKQRKKIIDEAMAAIRETENALQALDKNDSQTALAALERATGKLEIIVARAPELALAPSGVTTFTYDLIGTVEAVKAIEKKAKQALEDGRLQAARRMLRDLGSELVIRTTNIPLASYPQAMKQAARLVDEGKTDEAKAVLQSALGTLVITEHVIPLPVVAAETLLKKAETLVEKKGRTDAENKALAGLLKKARKELEFAEALGYGTKKEFAKMYEYLDEIEEKSSGGKSGAGFFDKIKKALGLAKGQGQESKAAEKE